MLEVFIPSYHRATNIKTAKFLVQKGYEAKKIHIIIDDEAEDNLIYKEEVNKLGCNLHIFNMEESRRRYDYIHRPSKSRRSAGQARNMFYDIAKKEGIEFYLVMDDDTTGFEIRPYGVYRRMATIDELNLVYNSIKEFMQRQKIGVFGLSQTGDMFARTNTKILRNKVMNTTFIDTRFIYRGERGVQDNDTSQFVGVMNEGFFTGSLASGLVLKQTSSATASGGLTDLYNECKLLNKSLIVPIQFPSLCHAEKQKRNGGRIHHKINNKHLSPKLIQGKRSNIAWDTYKEDTPFTNEPIRKNGTE
tara:strand:+ start:1144 stop:2055 length:912 start_codon:yes stop_codon:yes gene_type:complete